MNINKEYFFLTVYFRLVSCPRNGINQLIKSLRHNIIQITLKLALFTTTLVVIRPLDNRMNK